MIGDKAYKKFTVKKSVYAPISPISKTYSSHTALN